MKGDFTRDTFDATRHYTRVLMQQGRVQLDADFNEMNAILLNYLRSFSKDIIGPHGGPVSNLGYEIVDINYLSEDDKELLTEAGVLPLDRDDFLLGSGHYYVNGMLCENNKPIAYSQQIGFPFLEDEQIDNDQAYLVFLDVWERYVTVNEDDHIREVALGDSDTAGRAQLMTQVKIPSLGQEYQAQLKILWDDLKNAGDDQAKIDEAKQKIDEFAEAQRQRFAQMPMPFLRARARVAQTPDDPCTIPPQAQYRGAENQLYRVEIHTSGQAKNESNTNFATFKWSRENGSVVFPIRTLSGTVATVAHLGHGARLGLQVNDWIEVVDDELVARGESGELIQVTSIDSVEMKVTLKESASKSYNEDSSMHPFLRRWDQSGKESNLENGALPVTEGDGEADDQWILLEDGVQIQFSKSPETSETQYEAGDYWLIPARTATHDVEWGIQLEPDGILSKYPSDVPIPAAEFPHGIVHHFAPLAVIALGTNPVEVKLVHDCRRSFKQLWELRSE